MKLYCIDLESVRDDTLISEILDVINELQDYTDTEITAKKLYKIRKYIVEEIL